MPRAIPLRSGMAVTMLLLATVTGPCLAQEAPASISGEAPASSPYAADPATSPVGILTLRQALTLAATTHPRLAGHRFALDAATARQDQASLRNPLQLGIDVENVGGTGGTRFIGDTEVTLSLGTVLDLEDKRGRRMDVARQERAQILSEQDAEKIDILAEVTRRFIDVVVNQELLALARRQEAMAARALDAANTRYRAAKALPGEVARAEVSVTQAKLVRLRSEQELHSARLLLAEAWADRDPRFELAAAKLLDMPAPLPVSTIQARMERNPDLLRFASERRTLEARTLLAESARTPDLTVSAGIRRLEGQNGQAFVMSLTMPLGTAARAEPGIREARAATGLALAREQAARTSLYNTLASLHAGMERARQALKLLQEEAAPKARAAIAAIEDGYKAGRLSLLELTEANRQLVELEQAMITEAADYHRLAIEAERLTGQTLAPQD